MYLIHTAKWSNKALEPTVSCCFRQLSLFVESQQDKEPNHGLPRHGKAIPDRMERTQC
jgi:hypothetical protein